MTRKEIIVINTLMSLWNSIRHTFATSFIMGGGNLENLRVLLGHSSYAVTQNYIKLATELSLVDYNIYKIDDIYFNSYDYHKR